MENEKLLRVSRVRLMPLIIFISMLSSGCSTAALAKETSEKFANSTITVSEATDFCLKVWFPRLVLGRTLSPDALAKHLDRLLEVYSQKIQISDPNNAEVYGKAVIQGHPEVRKFYGTILPLYPNWKFQILAIYPTPKGFILHYRGTNAPPVKSFDGVDILEIERPTDKVADWKISRLDGFYDRQPFYAGEGK